MFVHALLFYNRQGSYLSENSGKSQGIKFQSGKTAVFGKNQGNFFFRGVGHIPDTYSANCFQIITEGILNPLFHGIDYFRGAQAANKISFQNPRKWGS